MTEVGEGTMDALDLAEEIFPAICRAIHPWDEGQALAAASATIEALRALPVEERAAAVGLVAGDRTYLGQRYWVEAESPPQRSEEQA